MEDNNGSKQIEDYLKEMVDAIKISDPTIIKSEDSLIFKSSKSPIYQKDKGTKSRLVKDLADMVLELREKNVDLINHNANLKAELKEFKDNKPKKWYQVFKSKKPTLSEGKTITNCKSRTTPKPDIKPMPTLHNPCDSSNCDEGTMTAR
jgi:hypothetical protein